MEDEGDQSGGILEYTEVIYEELRNSWHPVNAILSSFYFIHLFIHILFLFVSSRFFFHVDSYNQLGRNVKKEKKRKRYGGSLNVREKKLMILFSILVIKDDDDDNSMFEFKSGFYDIIVELAQSRLSNAPTNDERGRE